MSHSGEKNTGSEADSTLTPAPKKLPSDHVDFSDGNGQELARIDSADPSISRPGLASNVIDHIPDVPEDVSSSVGNRSDIFGLHGMQVSSDETPFLQARCADDHGLNPPVIPPRDTSTSSPSTKVYLLPVANKRKHDESQQNARQLLTHSHHDSVDSEFSFSSHDPPSTAYEPRISISSTIYASSTCDSALVRDAFQAADRRLDEERASNPPSVPSTTNAVPNVHPSFGSIIDLASTPESPDADVISLPQFATPDEASGPNTQRSSSLIITDDELRDSQTSIPPRAFMHRAASSIGPPMRHSNSPNPSLSPKLSSLIPYSLLTSFTHTESVPSEPRPPTTNNLNAQERSELIRKNRKLAQVFGETPSPMSGAEDLPDSPVVHNCLLPIMPNKRTHSRGPSTLSEAGPILTDSHLVLRFRDDKQKSASPLSPMTFRSSYLLNEDDDEDDESPSSYESPIAQTPSSPKMKETALDEARAAEQPPAIEPSDSFIDLTGAEMRGILIPKN
jgi:hypothetical protein